MFVLWLILFTFGGTSLACLFMAASHRTPPAAPLRVIPGGLGRIWPAWWDQLDQWRDEA